MSALRATLDIESIDITLNERIIGSVTQNPFGGHNGNQCKLRATFKAGYTILCGYGDTPEEAIANGFVSTRKELERSLALIAELEKQMYAE